MTGRVAIWNIMLENIPRRQWISIGEIFSIVESRSDLDNEDLELNPLQVPRWKINVRRALMNKKRAGRIQGRKKLR